MDTSIKGQALNEAIDVTKTMLGATTCASVPSHESVSQFLQATYETLCQLHADAMEPTND
ncbi:MAG: hypothetical protein IKG21_12040 [Atopobiaceae bacterium]|nr:hypothetical protein [Atopobiaceae bacterium]